jgi:hypothetical protein
LATRGLSEVVGALAVLMVTIAVLGGLSAIALASVRGAGNLLSADSQAAARNYGLQLALVAVQSNSTGSYAWIFDYGWEQGSLTSVYVNGGSTQWASTCTPLRPESMCSVALPPSSHGQVTAVFGTKTLGFTV